MAAFVVRPGVCQSALGKLAKVEGPGAGQVYLAPETAKIFAAAEDQAKAAKIFAVSGAR